MWIWFWILLCCLTPFVRVVDDLHPSNIFNRLNGSHEKRERGNAAPHGTVPLWANLTSSNYRYIMNYQELSWIIMNHHERLWIVMNDCEISWNIMNDYELSWMIMNYLELSWYIMTYPWKNLSSPSSVAPKKNTLLAYHMFFNQRLGQVLYLRVHQKRWSRGMECFSRSAAFVHRYHAVQSLVATFSPGPAPRFFLSFRNC